VRAIARRACTAAVVLIAALGSLATTAIECPYAVGLPGGADVESNAVATEHYVLTAPVIDKLHLLVTGTSAAEAEVRVRLAPDDPALFQSANDGGSEQAVTLALRPGSEATADLELPPCYTGCADAGVSVVVEHLSGSSASLRWDLTLETASCEEDFHASVERR
jgi:hypothetical protein